MTKAKENSLRDIDLARRLLLAFGATRFVIVGRLPDASRALLNDAGSELCDGWMSASIASAPTCLVCVDLSDEALSLALSDPAAAQASGIYIQHRATPQAKSLDMLERLCFELGYRKHPAYHHLFGYAELELQSPEFATLLEPLGGDTLPRFPTARLLEERDLHMDMLRETGRRADAHIMRYEWASQFIRPNDTVLDAACGLGYGTHVMRHRSRGSRFFAIDGSNWAIDYASACFARAGTEYIAGMLPEALSRFEDSSVDVVVSFETLEHVPDPAGLLAQFRRVLRPGGRVIVSVPNDWSDETGEDPNPHHLHVYTWQRLQSELAAGYIVEHAVRQIASGCKRLGAACEWTERPRTLEAVEPDAASGIEAEWWLAVGMKSPEEGLGLPYRETVHDGFDGATHLVDFGEHYQNPWLVHAMIEIPYRLQRPEELGRLASELSRRCPRDSADNGAALAVMSYRALDDHASEEELVALEAQIGDYLALTSDNPHVRRWQVSLAYARARLRLRRGERAAAIEDFTRVARTEVRWITPTLGTKTVDAAFWLGLLWWLSSEPQSARLWWQRGLESASQLLGCDWVEFYGNASAPLVFPMNDAVEISDRAAACAQALSITHNPTPATSALLHAISQQSLRSAVRQQSADLASSRVEAGNLRSEFARVCQELEAQRADKEGIETLSIDRLSQIIALETRVEKTDAALRLVERMSIERLETNRALEARLKETDAALDGAKELTLKRLEEMKALESRLQETDSALDAAKELTVRRLEEIKALETRLKETDAALDGTKKLTMQRVGEFQALEARLEATDEALDCAKALTAQRLEEIQELEARLFETDSALNDTKELSLERLARIQELEERIKRTDAGLREAQALGIERLNRIHELESRHVADGEPASAAPERHQPDDSLKTMPTIIG
ncbi:class I SAM-dependent methyltransferase [Dyella japonica]|uniref:class I SAM-dependent methyltransferase n=1 Tax=Dyella japonica TaxID=231455 RepID=UPI000AC281FF|nr:class I SAM-dependent methyltransferase [Dyella japonica]